MENNKENVLRVDLSQAPWIKCEGENMVWETSMLFKRLSPLMSPSGKEELIPAEVVVCKKCGKVPQFFWEKAKEIPEELRSTCGLPSASEIILEK